MACTIDFLGDFLDFLLDAVIVLIDEMNRLGWLLVDCLHYELGEFHGTFATLHECVVQCERYSEFSTMFADHLDFLVSVISEFVEAYKY